MYSNAEKQIRYVQNQVYNVGVLKPETTIISVFLILHLKKKFLKNSKKVCSEESEKNRKTKIVFRKHLGRYLKIPNSYMLHNMIMLFVLDYFDTIIKISDVQ